MPIQKTEKIFVAGHRGMVGFDGGLSWDKIKPDGLPRKLRDVSKLRALGWTPTIPLRDGIARTYDWFLKNIAQ